MSSSEEEREVCIESAAEVGKTRPHAGTKDIQCSICTRMYEVSRCINAGDKVYASWRCKPCHDAPRLLERAIESKGQQAKEKAQLLRKVRRDQWRRLVAWVRIAHPDDEMNEYDKDESIMGEDTGPSAGMQKAVDSSSYVVEQRTSVMMMTKRQFKAHFIQTEMLAKDEAETFWHNCLTNKDIYRETEDGSTSLAVKLPKVYSGSTLVARARQAEERKDIANIAECATQVRSAPDLSTEVLSSNGAFICLQPGSHVEAPDSEDSKKSPLTEKSLSCLGSCASPDLATPPSKRARTWAEMSAHLSSVASSVGGEGAEAGDSKGQQVINLVKVRTEVIAEAKRIHNHIVEKKGGSNKALRELVERLGCDHGDVVTLGLQSKFSQFDEAAKVLKHVLESARNWTQGSVEEEAQKAWSAMSTLEVLHTDFTSILAALKKVRRHEVCMSTSDKRKLGTHIRQVVGKGALTVQGVPKGFAFWLGEVVLGVQVGKDSIDDRRKLSDGMASKTQANIGFKDVFLLKATDESELAKGFQAMRTSMQKQVAKVSKALRDHLGKNENVYFNIAKVGLKGEAAAAFIGLGWLPEALRSRDSGVAPSHLNSFGGALITLQRKWAFRWGADYIPYIGLGGFAHGLDGVAMIVVWPISALVSAGADPMETDTYFNGLTNSDCAAFMAKHALFFELSAGSSAYIPPGWHAAWLCVPDWATIMYQPWPQHTLLAGLDTKVRQKVIQQLLAFADRKTNDKNFSADTTALSKWLSS